MRRPHQQNIDTDAASLTLGDGIWAHCLLTSEVLLLLQDLQERRREEARTLPLPPPSKVFLDTLEYAKAFSQYTNRELIRAIRQTMSDSPLREFEMAQIGNLAPSTVEEAQQLIPSLRTLPSSSGGGDETTVDGDDLLQRILDDITTTRKYEQ